MKILVQRKSDKKFMDVRYLWSAEEEFAKVFSTAVSAIKAIKDEGLKTADCLLWCHDVSGLGKPFSMEIEPLDIIRGDL